MLEADLKRNQKTQSATQRYVKKIIESMEKLLKDGGEEKANKLLTIEQLADLKEIDKVIVRALQESKLDNKSFRAKILQLL